MFESFIVFILTLGHELLRILSLSQFEILVKKLTFILDVDAVQNAWYFEIFNISLENEMVAIDNHIVQGDIQLIG